MNRVVIWGNYIQTFTIPKSIKALTEARTDCEGLRDGTSFMRTEQSVVQKDRKTNVVRAQQGLPQIGDGLDIRVRDMDIPSLIKTISINYTPDSFLQSNLKICIQLYDYIIELLNKIDTDKIMCFGDDTCNIANYVEKQAWCYLHCKETMDMNVAPLCKTTLNIDEWKCNKFSNVLITTPGRNGFKLAEIEPIKLLDFKYIIYIGCKLKTVAKDFKFFNNFEILNSKQFEMFGMEQTEYVSTVQLWCKPSLISIGNNCSIAYHLNNISYPFDWCNSPKIQIILDILKDNFICLLNKNNYSEKNKFNKYFYEKTKTLEMMNVVRFKFKNNYIDLLHDFRACNSFDSEFNIYSEKMKRRIDRINKFCFKIFIRYESNPQQLTIDLIVGILNYCNRLIIIIPCTKMHYEIVSFKHDRLQIIGDDYLEEHVSWKREGLSNCSFLRP